MGSRRALYAPSTRPRHGNAARSRPPRFSCLLHLLLARRIGALTELLPSSMDLCRSTGIPSSLPEGEPDTVEVLRAAADDVTCPVTPEPLISIGRWYEDFTQVSDKEVRDLLEHARRHLPQA